jgi:hypothetical protein
MTVSTPISKDTPVKSWEEMYCEVAKKWTDSAMKCAQLSRFCRQHLETIEGFYATDPGSLSPEHIQEYIETAQFMADNYGRVNNMIKEFKELI